MTGNDMGREERDHSLEAEPEDVEGHYLPLDEEGQVDFSPQLPSSEEDVEGHAELDRDLDFERRR